MSNRERWIVYPLLFLALGLALRDKVTRSITTKALFAEGPLRGESLQAERGITTKKIVCQQIVVVDNQRRPIATIGSESWKGKAVDRASPIRIYNENRKVSAQLGAKSLCEELHVVGPSGRSEASLTVVSVKDAEGVEHDMGNLLLRGFGSRPVVEIGGDMESRSGMISTIGTDGRPKAVIHTNRFGGEIALIDNARNLEMHSGYGPSGVGTWVISKDRQVVPLTRLVKFTPNVQPPEDKPDTKQPSEAESSVAPEEKEQPAESKEPGPDEPAASKEGT